MTTMTFYGDWQQTKDWLSRVKRGERLKAFTPALKDLGDAIINRLTGHIRKQDLDWAPLSAFTLEGKSTSSVYLNTGEFIGSLKAKVTRVGKYGIRLDVSPRGVHSRDNIEMSTLASWLEYGTSRMPARPLWRPTFAEIPGMPEFKKMTEAIQKLGFRS